MLFKDVIDLVSIQTSKNENGFEEESEVIKSGVFANSKSIRSSEFYQSSQQGYKLEKMFEIRVDEYNEEPYLIFEGKKYKIERTYQKNTEIIELVCSLKQGI